MNLTFKSERLLFRPLDETDIDLVIALWTDPDVVKYVGGKTYTEDELAEEMPVSIRRCGGGCIGIWSLTELATKEKVGTAILLPLPIEEDDTNWNLVTGEGLPDGDIEIGYILRQSAWGKGYATEACARLLRFAFEESPLTEIVATFDDENTVSQRVLEKCGLTSRGRRLAYGEQSPDYRVTRQQWIDANQHGQQPR